MTVVGGGSAPRPGRLYPGKDPVPIVQETGWAPGPFWTGGKSRPHRDPIPDLPARSQSLYQLSYQAHLFSINLNILLSLLSSYFMFNLTVHLSP